jgi:3-hydroxyanthranilate 3,4-dioxygenase
MTPHPRFMPFNFSRWIDDNEEFLKPPVSNKLLHAGDGMIVMVVGGPNTRVDFHDDPVEEWFYQVRGDMMLKIAENNEIYDVPIREGEVFLLPPHTRHAPQRPRPGSVGLVVESPRVAGMVDAFEWFCFNCKYRVHRAEISLLDPSGIVTELPKVFDAFDTDLEARTCRKCGELHPGKGKPPEGWVVL